MSELNIIDLSVLKKDDLIIKSLEGTEYKIKGNFSTEFYLELYNAYQKIQKVGKGNFEKQLQLLKETVLSIIKMDNSKSPTIDTINSEFNDFKALEMCLSATMAYANSIVNDPNSNSPASI